MRTTGNGRNGYGGRLPLWLRALVVLAAGWAALLCGQQVAGAYGATMDYREAPVCAAGEGGDDEGCVRREAGTVLDRRTGVQCTSDGTGETAGGGTTCDRYYEVEVEWPGRTGWLTVRPQAYDEAGRGDRAQVRLWRGDVVGLRVAGHTHAYAPPSEKGILPWLALGCLVVATGAWAAVSGRLSSLFAFPNFGWLLVAIGVGWLGSMALLGGHLLVWGFAIVWTGFAVYWTVSARRF
ncbi:MAG TPA: hypothetical protein VFP69_01565 [Streptomyces sp.]|nr:hypothetical protein [Streptomyces sp.]